jgi:hypothetical protein
MFLALDKDTNGTLSKQELKEYADGTLTEIFVERGLHLLSFCMMIFFEPPWVKKVKKYQHDTLNCLFWHRFSTFQFSMNMFGGAKLVVEIVERWILKAFLTLFWH